MDNLKNYVIRINNNSQTKNLVNDLLGTKIAGFETLENKRGLLFSKSEVERFIDEEERHDVKVLTKDSSQSLKSMSSGEQKKALLQYLLSSKPDFLVLINPFDNLDTTTRKKLEKQLISISKSIILVQLISRLDDVLPIQAGFFKLDDNHLEKYSSLHTFLNANQKTKPQFIGTIPAPLHDIEVESDELINFNKVSVSFDGRKILNAIDWTIKKGEFWHLIGPNGSGKTTLLSMITGDSHKGYGQDLSIFGHKKGSGESVWDLKKNIGYYTPSMTDKFKGYHTVENMIISGFYDSIGLYIPPSDQEKNLVISWLTLLQLHHKRNTLFLDLTMGEKRLVMTARAMIKHPPLLILDEPTAGLDDKSASLFIALVNKIAQESDTAIIFVSHRKETGLYPQFNYVLEIKPSGSTGSTEKEKNS